MYINSRGGSVTAGLAIYDTMQVGQCDGLGTNVGLGIALKLRFMPCSTYAAQSQHCV